MIDSKGLKMTLPPAQLTTRTGALDFLLAEIVSTLQLTDTQIARVESAYRAIGDWLNHPDSPLAVYRPLIHPQGSVAIGTTVRPLLRAEFDLDFVVEVAFFPGTPMELYELVLKRLNEHGTYGKMIEPKRRCIRLRYEGDFHVDVLGARAAVRPVMPGAIEVPDRKTPTIWKPSNPRGYAAWFSERSRYAVQQRFLTDALPLPQDWAGSAKTVLQRVVQLTKRERDVAFKDDSIAPRSIVWTTLLARAFRGQLSVYEALVEALDDVAAMIQAARPGRLVVLNPTNLAEDFSERWAENPASYTAFVTDLHRFRARIHGLRDLEGLDQITKALRVLFGDDVANHATHRYQDAIADARRKDQLRAVGPTIISNSTAGRAIPSNRNYGVHY